mgnify:CR=1 FL=1
MKPVISCFCLIFLCALFSVSIYAQPAQAVKTIHITIHLSDKISYSFEKYLLFAYNQVGYKVIFDKILTARARAMVDAGRLDAIMVAEKEIEQVYTNLVRVPVMIAKGSLMLYCKKRVVCSASALQNANNIIGVVSGNSISANYMKPMRASTYAVKSQENLGVMLTKGRLDYVLVVYEDRLGNIGNFDESPYQKVEIYRSEAYHYIHKKHRHLLPKLTKALELAIEKYGALVLPDEAENN